MTATFAASRKRGFAEAYGASLALALFVCSSVTHGQAQQPCGPEGYRVVAHSWDAVLKRGWESRQVCMHPDWPLRLVATTSEPPNPAALNLSSNTGREPAMSQGVAGEFLVKAGDPVEVWMQDNNVRIELAGTAERSARQGEPVMVQVPRQDDSAGATMQRIAGRVSGAGKVEMER